MWRLLIYWLKLLTDRHALIQHAVFIWTSRLNANWTAFLQYLSGLVDHTKLVYSRKPLSRTLNANLYSTLFSTSRFLHLLAHRWMLQRECGTVYLVQRHFNIWPGKPGFKPPPSNWQMDSSTPWVAAAAVWALCIALFVFPHHRHTWEGTQSKENVHFCDLGSLGRKLNISCVCASPIQVFPP